MHEGQLQRIRRIEVTPRRRAARLGKAAGFVVFVVCALLIAGAVASDEPMYRIGAGVLSVLFGIAALLVTLVVAPIAASFARTRFSGPLALESTHDEIRVVAPDGRARFAVKATDVGAAWQRGPLRVELATVAGDEVRLHFDSPEDAVGAIAALRGRARDRRAYPLALESDVVELVRHAHGWARAALLVPVALAADGVASMAWCLVALGLGWLFTRPRRLVLGADGVIIERRFEHRYVAFREIASVERTRPFVGRCSVVLSLTDGTRVVLARGLENERAKVMESLLNEGRAMVQRGHAAGASSAVLANDEALSLTEWMRSLAFASKRADYRDTALDVERLASLARNPAADREQRIAAAVALRAVPSGLARVRVAAEVTAEPEVRAALEALAEEEVDQRRVERALRRLRR